jgi:hypothetical protein
MRVATRDDQTLLEPERLGVNAVIDALERLLSLAGGDSPAEHRIFSRRHRWPRAGDFRST